MLYNPQHKNKPLIPKGDYDLEIVKVENTKEDGSELEAKDGSRMQVVTFRVHAEYPAYIRKWFIFNERMTYLYLKLARALGRPDSEFDSGQFDAAKYVGHIVKGHVTIKSNDKYGDQNEIESFVTEPGEATKRINSETATAGAGKAATKIGEDDIPF